MDPSLFYRNLSSLQKIHEVSHYHWLDWPDRGVPAADLSIMMLLDQVSYR